ncbi:LytR/AlgR family response regulator transcription factor [Anaerosacchariphilus polymeriproducens]|uniref:LytR/AlgR family response regulator transcription factor n=1 Tax=Anaerosacchariphilus polymeriproducens TaxID=1812858 RepID=UPI0013905EB8|nr:LytTR family DNA-binding domain-containing protein [Anaerosacchariphilus polymeriproducens]
MKIAVCEDEKLFQNQIIKLIDKYYHNLDTLIDTFDSGEEFLKRYQSGYTYDLILLDIEMKKLDGITTAKKLRAFGGNEFIVFLTSHTEFAMEGYEVEAVRFLAKPVKEEKMFETLKEIDRRMEQRETMLLHTQKEEVIVEIRDIVYIESVRNDVFVFVRNNSEGDKGKYFLSEYRVRKRIKDFEMELSKKQFFRCHRSYIINLDYLTSYHAREVTIFSDICLPISRGRDKELKEKIIHCIKTQ